MLALDGEPRVFAATTVATADDHDTCDTEPDGDGGDWVFQFTLPEAASLRVLLEDGDGLDANLVIRPDCAVADEFCFLHDPADPTKEYALHTEADTFSVIVDSVGATAGDFILYVEATAPGCGDGILNPGEDCDPGAGVADDGCFDPGSAGECTFEPVEATFDDCPGEGIAIPEGETILSAAQGYSTLGFTDDHSGSCEELPGGVDRVFQLTPAVTGMMTVSYGGDENGDWICDTAGFDDPRCWDGYLYARATCDIADPELDCSNNLVNEIAVNVVAGVPVWVFVDGYDESEFSRGFFDLSVELIGL